MQYMAGLQGFPPIKRLVRYWDLLALQQGRNKPPGRTSQVERKRYVFCICSANVVLCFCFIHTHTYATRVSANLFSLPPSHLAAMWQNLPVIAWMWFYKLLLWSQWCPPLDCRQWCWPKRSGPQCFTHKHIKNWTKRNINLSCLAPPTLTLVLMQKSYLVISAQSKLVK